MNNSFTAEISFPSTLIGLLNGKVRHFSRQVHVDILGRKYIEYLESYWEVVPFEKLVSLQVKKKYSALRWIGGKPVVTGNPLLKDDQLSFFD